MIIDLLQNSGVWVLISFTIFSVFAFRAGKSVVLGKLDGRIEEIRREIESAESLRVEAQELLAQYQRRQRDTAREAETILANARAHADEIRKQAEKDMAEELQRRENQAADRLKRMEDAALAEIRGYAAELTVKATAELIASRMDEKSNARLIEQSIKTISGQIN